MLIDMDVVHATLQFPVAVVEAAAALLMAMRYHHVTHAEDVVPLDRRLTLFLALFMGAIAINKFYWVLWGNAQAADIVSVAEWLRRGHWFASASNSLITIFGLVLIARVGRMFIGRWSDGLAAVASVALVGVGFAMATWRSWGT